LKTKDRTFQKAQNELVFEREKHQKNTGKWPKTGIYLASPRSLGAGKALRGEPDGG